MTLSRASGLRGSAGHSGGWTAPTLLLLCRCHADVEATALEGTMSQTVVSKPPTHKSNMHKRIDRRCMHLLIAVLAALAACLEG